METNVWTTLFARGVDTALQLLKSLTGVRNPVSLISLPNAQENAVNSSSKSKTILENQFLLKLKRNPQIVTTDGVFGDMVYNGERICFTMENRALLIPAGQYQLEIYDSPHAGHPVPRLQNVPGRSEIEIHCGNVPEDSKGCIIVGLDRIEDKLERSRDAFNLLFPQIEEALKKGPQTIEITD